MNKPIIMVVDDCEVTLDVTRIHLEEAGYEVITRSRAIGTTSEIMCKRPHCVLLDVSMPGLLGTDITKIVRENMLYEIKVVLFSAKDESELRHLAYECKADGYIKKTDNIPHFLSQVKSFISPQPKTTTP